MVTKVSIGDIIRFEGELFLVTLNPDRCGYMSLTYLTGCNAGMTILKHVVEVCNNIEMRYGGFGDFLESNCESFKKKISLLNKTILSQKDEYRTSREELADAWNVISAKNDEIISLSDEIGALKDELQEHYEIADFKNKEIKRLQKENLKSVSKEAFDKAVNDMLNNKDISTVEEVSAIMKLRSAIY